MPAQGTRQHAWNKRNPWARHVEYARRRCSDSRNDSWASHGGKGIKVRLTVDEARELWERDGAAKLRKPSLDRIDPLKDYEKENCRFIEHWLNSRLPHDPHLQEQIPSWVVEDINETHKGDENDE